MEHQKTFRYTTKNQFSNQSSFYWAHWFASPIAPLHTHANFYELIITIEPHCEHFFHDKHTLLPAHTAMLLPPGSTHSLTHEPSRGKKITNQFVIDIDQYWFENFLIDHKSILPNLTIKAGLFFVLSNSEFLYLQKLAHLLTDKSTSHTNHSQIIKTILYNILFLYSNKRHSLINTSLPPAEELKAKFDKFEYLSSDINKIYSSFPVSKSLLISKFKELTGKTIVQYRTEKRIQQAEKLLLYTDYSILEISLQVGYDSISHFIKNFKAITGNTPMQYKKSPPSHDN